MPVAAEIHDAGHEDSEGLWMEYAAIKEKWPLWRQIAQKLSLFLHN
ncbi:hypothetical protein [Oryzomonas rubra]|nr:hypothetical protein [Oryzomonas rubra]